MDAPTVSQVSKERTSQLLDDLPPESLTVVEQLVMFLHERGSLVLGPRYPTVVNPASSLSAWLDLIPEGWGGDALADTEALHDEV